MNEHLPRAILFSITTSELKPLRSGRTGRTVRIGIFAKISRNRSSFCLFNGLCSAVTWSLIVIDITESSIDAFLLMENSEIQSGE